MKPHARFLKARTRTRTRRNASLSTQARSRTILTHGSLKNHLLGVLLVRSCPPTTNGHTCPDLTHSLLRPTLRATLPTGPGARVNCARANQFASAERTARRALSPVARQCSTALRTSSRTASRSFACTSRADFEYPPGGPLVAAACPGEAPGAIGACACWLRSAAACEAIASTTFIIYCTPWIRAYRPPNKAIKLN